MTNGHILLVVLSALAILAGVGLVGFGILSKFADGMSDAPGQNSGGCTMCVIGLALLAFGVAGVLL